MSTELRRLRALTAVSLLSVGVLTGCTPPAAEPDDTTSIETDAAAPAEPEEEMVSGPECLIGEWYIAEDQMQGFYSAVSGSNEGLDISVEGGTGLSFSDTTYTYTPDFTILLEVAGSEGVGTITGAISGDYEATETTIKTSHEESDIAVTVSVGGISVDGTDLSEGFINSAPINSAPYECGAEGPIIEFATGDGNPTVAMQLTPAS
ncbi:hypothetical protein [Salinibacterium sp. SWN1162]|uniref:hypothetical protein n=1 Tax=Salinibacterium sp. SWN1162 TaxID=2792053 RepID=UPI0018CE4200|nr:hypothetical protein [Salinibacterium sp. SWN1162]MBH0009678.1 hypothetical protein [Salinibacterium sp. SWN1162]